jgi:uncharacterized protein (TIGR02001 family)
MFRDRGHVSVAAAQQLRMMVPTPAPMEVCPMPVRLLLPPVALLAAAGVASAAAAQSSVSVGVALTSDYVSSGATQTDGGPALQPYVEVGFPSGFYLGVWASNVDFGDDNRVEIDLYAGFRNEVGRLSYDLSYYRYYYDGTGFDSDELILALGVSATDRLSVALELSSDLDGGSTVTPGFAYALPAGLELSANWDINSDESESWDIGVGRSLGDTVSVDLRWYDATTVEDGRVAVTLSWDSDLSTLFGG